MDFSSYCYTTSLMVSVLLLSIREGSYRPQFLSTFSCRVCVVCDVMCVVYTCLCAVARVPCTLVGGQRRMLVVLLLLIHVLP